MGGVILIKIFVQYLLTPIPFLLTFVTPILFFLISRKYVWLSIPLTVLVELLVNWRNFTYYESRGLMILVTLFQLAIMAIVIILLKTVLSKKKTSVYKGYKQDKIEMRGDRAEMSDFPLYLNTVVGGLDRRDQTIGGFSFVVKIYAVPVVEIIG